jgi:6-phosphogluconolactonase (cycloisomerase 2 family)
VKIFCLSSLLALVALFSGCVGINPNFSALTPSTPAPSGGVSGQAEPPRVAEVSPGPGATCIAANAVVTATFSEALDPATVNANTFFIQGVSGTVTYDAQKLKATLSPVSPLQANTSYSVTITTGIATSGDTHLTAGFQSSFITGPCNSRSSTEFVYVANLGSASNPGGSISGFEVERKTGELKPVPGSPFPAGDGPFGMASDLSGDHVFVLENGFSQPDRSCEEFKGILLSENINHGSGALTLADKVTLAGFCPQSMVVSPDGKNLYVTMLVGGPNVPGECCLGEIQAFSIGQKGLLTEIAGSPFQVTPPLERLAMHPNGTFLYASAGDNRNGIVLFGRDPATGALAPSITAFAMPWENLAIVPSGKFLIGASFSIIDQVRVFAIDSSTAALTPQMPMAIWRPAALDVDPSGKFVAFTRVPDRPNPADILVYRIDDTGTLTQVPGPAPTIGMWPSEVKFDPEGKFVYAIASLDNSIAGFAFDQKSGALTPLTQSLFKTGDSPESLTIVRVTPGN